MALISCPECGHQVSDSAATCPNCGVTIKSPETNKTRIGELEKHYFLGGILVAIGIFMWIVGFLLFLVTTIVGIIFIAFGGLALIYGIKLISGRKDCICPYCGKPGKLSDSDLSYQCPGCQRTSFVKGDYLQP